MQRRISAKKQNGLTLIKAQTLPLLWIILGSVFLGLMAQVAVPIPFTPVPLSLQSLGVSLLAITLGSKRAPLAVVTYLLQATCGLPVLAYGVCKPLWILFPTAGYLISFVIASYVTAALLEKQRSPSHVKTWLILSLNEGIILTIGSLWLTLFVGWNNALALGVIPFLPGALIKITAATTAYRPLKSVRSLINP
jgi:biotin transport system substrate-specific component